MLRLKLGDIVRWQGDEHVVIAARTHTAMLRRLADNDTVWVDIPSLADEITIADPGIAEAPARGLEPTITSNKNSSGQVAGLRDGYEKPMPSPRTRRADKHAATARRESQPSPFITASSWSAANTALAWRPCQRCPADCRTRDHRRRPAATTNRRRRSGFDTGLRPSCRSSQRTPDRHYQTTISSIVCAQRFSRAVPQPSQPAGTGHRLRANALPRGRAPTGLALAARAGKASAAHAAWPHRTESRPRSRWGCQ